SRMLIEPHLTQRRLNGTPLCGRFKSIPTVIDMSPRLADHRRAEDRADKAALVRRPAAIWRARRTWPDQFWTSGGGRMTAPLFKFLSVTDQRLIVELECRRLHLS